MSVCFMLTQLVRVRVMLNPWRRCQLCRCVASTSAPGFSAKATHAPNIRRPHMDQQESQLPLKSTVCTADQDPGSSRAASSRKSSTRSFACAWLGRKQAPSLPAAGMASSQVNHPLASLPAFNEHPGSTEPLGNPSECRTLHV